MPQSEFSRPGADFTSSLSRPSQTHPPERVRNSPQALLPAWPAPASARCPPHPPPFPRYPRGTADHRTAAASVHRSCREIRKKFHGPHRSAPPHSTHKRASDRRNTKHENCLGTGAATPPIGSTPRLPCSRLQLPELNVTPLHQ